MRSTLATTLVVAFLPATVAVSVASAHEVQVTINGTVEYNQVQVPPFAGQGPGSPVTISFLLDSHDFVDSLSFPVRAYFIDQDSFTITVGAAQVGLAASFPAGQVPSFVIRNNDPAVDGFYLSMGVDLPSSLPLAAPGAFGAFGSAFSVGYDGGTLTSLDIEDAYGFYDYTGLTNFFMAVTDGGFEPIGIEFEDMTIAEIPVPGTVAPLAALAFLRRRRR